eukprot:1015941-Amphidinium_carterae.1
MAGKHSWSSGPWTTHWHYTMYKQAIPRVVRARKCLQVFRREPSIMALHRWVCRSYWHTD